MLKRRKRILLARSGRNLDLFDLSKSLAHDQRRSHEAEEAGIDKYR